MDRMIKKLPMGPARAWKQEVKVLGNDAHLPEARRKTMDPFLIADLLFLLHMAGRFSA
jgi:hypothetical protein